MAVLEKKTENQQFINEYYLLMDNFVRSCGHYANMRRANENYCERGASIEAAKAFRKLFPNKNVSQQIEKQHQECIDNLNAVNRKASVAGIKTVEDIDTVIALLSSGYIANSWLNKKGKVHRVYEDASRRNFYRRKFKQMAKRRLIVALPVFEKEYRNRGSVRYFQKIWNPSV